MGSDDGDNILPGFELSAVGSTLPGVEKLGLRVASASNRAPSQTQCAAPPSVMDPKAFTAVDFTRDPVENERRRLKASLKDFFRLWGFGFKHLALYPHSV